MYKNTKKSQPFEILTCSLLEPSLYQVFNWQLKTRPLIKSYNQGLFLCNSVYPGLIFSGRFWVQVWLRLTGSSFIWPQLCSARLLAAGCSTGKHPKANYSGNLNSGKIWLTNFWTIWLLAIQILTVDELEHSLKQQKSNQDHCNGYLQYSNGPKLSDTYLNTSPLFEWLKFYLLFRSPFK